MARAVYAARQHAKADEHMPFQRQPAPEAPPQAKTPPKRPQQPGGQRQRKHQHRGHGVELTEQLVLLRDIQSGDIAPVLLFKRAQGALPVFQRALLVLIQLAIGYHRARPYAAAVSFLHLGKIALRLPRRPIRAHRRQQHREQGDAHKRHRQPYKVKGLQSCSQCPTPPSGISGFSCPALSFRANCAHAP